MGGINDHDFMEKSKLTEYKHQINKVLQDIEDGTAAKTLEKEKKFI